MQSRNVAGGGGIRLLRDGLGGAAEIGQAVCLGHVRLSAERTRIRRGERVKPVERLLAAANSGQRAPE